MNPRRAFRRLRDDERWVGLPPTRPRSGRRAAALRPVLVTLAVLALVAGGSAAVIGYTAQHPAHLASPSPSPSATPAGGALACGESVSRLHFTAGSEGTATLPHDRGWAALGVANYAARSDGTGTDVTALIAAGDGTTSSTARVGYGGALDVGLVRDGRVVALATGRTTTGAVGYDQTGAVTAALRAVDCSSRRALADGDYGLVATGIRAAVRGSRLEPVAAVKPVRLAHGLLVGGLVTVSDGPWRGTGVPGCGTAIDARRQAELDRFVAESSTRAAAAGITLTVTGSTVHANGQGYDFAATVTRRVTDAASQPADLSAREVGATTVISGGRIVSAPDSGAVVQAPSTIPLRLGAAITLGSDAPDAGCGVTADGTGHYPALPDVVHTAYVEFGVTSTGIPLVATVRYTEARGERPRILP